MQPTTTSVTNQAQHSPSKREICDDRQYRIRLPNGTAAWVSVPPSLWQEYKRQFLQVSSPKKAGRLRAQSLLNVSNFVSFSSYKRPGISLLV